MSDWEEDCSPPVAYTSPIEPARTAFGRNRLVFLRETPAAAGLFTSLLVVQGLVMRDQLAVDLGGEGEEEEGTGDLMMMKIKEVT